METLLLIVFIVYLYFDNKQNKRLERLERRLIYRQAEAIAKKRIERD